MQFPTSVLEGKDQEERQYINCMLAGGLINKLAELLMNDVTSNQLYRI